MLAIVFLLQAWWRPGPRRSPRRHGRAAPTSNFPKQMMIQKKRKQNSLPPLLAWLTVWLTVIRKHTHTHTRPRKSQKALCKFSNMSSSIIVTGNVNSKLKRPQKWWKEMTPATLHVPISPINVTFKLSLSSPSQRPRVFKPWCDTNASVWKLQLHWLRAASRLQCLRRWDMAAQTRRHGWREVSHTSWVLIFSFLKVWEINLCNS